MSKSSVARDERTVAVENASYRLGYLILTFGLLVVIAYRANAWGESNWDLFGLIFVSGFVTTFYQQLNHVLTSRWALVAVASVLIAAGIASAIVFVMR